MLGILAQLVLCRLTCSDAVLYRVVKIGVEEKTRTIMKSESSHSRKRVKVRPTHAPFLCFVVVPIPCFTKSFNPTSACC